jgi:hypothetical protein
MATRPSANAVRAVWPVLPGPSLTMPFLARCEHHLHVNGAESMEGFLRSEGWDELQLAGCYRGSATARTPAPGREPNAATVRLRRCVVDITPSRAAGQSASDATDVAA